ncbi:MAG: hypothetical protein R2809_04080 [Flavobacteriales bacterium]
MKYLAAFFIALSIFACKENKSALPVNVVESEVKDFNTNNSLGAAKKTNLIDTITNEVVGEKYYHKDNSLYMDLQLKDGKRVGEAKAFFANGKMQSLHHYKEGILHGEYKVWYENGNLRIDGQYSEGAEAGIWKLYDENGKLIENRDFDKNPLK